MLEAELFWKDHQSLLKDFYPGINERIFYQLLKEKIFSAELKNDILAGKPFAYILGYQYFYDLKIEVNSHVLIPRQETELILEMLTLKPHSKILDLCCGPGTIGLGLASYHKIPLDITFSDISSEAIVLANRNAETLKTHFHQETKFFFDCSDLAQGVNDYFDAIVCNPPYIPQSKRNLVHQKVIEYEPALALFLDDDRYIDFFKKLLMEIKRSLMPAGQFILECHEDMIEDTLVLVNETGFNHAKMIPDLTGRPRFIQGQKNS